MKTVHTDICRMIICFLDMSHFSNISKSAYRIVTRLIAQIAILKILILLLKVSVLCMRMVDQLMNSAIVALLIIFLEYFGEY